MNAAQVAQDMAASFGKSSAEIAGAAEQIKQQLGGVAPELFDPAIPEAQFLQGTLAYALARTENPSGEVSRQAYDRALERLQGGFFQNTASAKAAIGSFRNVLKTEAGAIGALRAPGVTPPTGAPGIPEPPVGAPGSAGAPTAPPARVRRYNPATGTIE